jgi:hypothetical protein
MTSTPRGTSAPIREYAVHPGERAFLLFAYVTAAVIVTYICGVAQQCNNFHIFRSAFENLVAQRDLYAPHPSQHSDLYKYSPTFALVFAPFAVTPFALALLGWNLLNVLLVYWSVHRLLSRREGSIALIMLYPGLVATLDGTQSNGLVAAFIALAWLALERESLAGQLRAATAIALGAFVKIFPLVALCFALVHPRRGRFAMLFALISLALAAMPIAVTPLSRLVEQYGSWYALEQVDALDRGASVMRLLHSVFGYTGPNWPVQLVGTVLLLAALLRRSRWSDRGFRRELLCASLVYAVIFNHKAEQPSFVIALVGVVVWYAAGLSRSRRTLWQTLIAAATLLAMIPVLIGAVAPHWLGVYAGLPLQIAAASSTLVWLSMEAELLDAHRLVLAARKYFTPQPVPVPDSQRLLPTSVDAA